MSLHSPIYDNLPERFSSKEDKCECQLQDGSIHLYDVCSENIDYPKRDNRNLKYLGQGIMYSYNGVRQSYHSTYNNNKQHFWQVEKPTATKSSEYCTGCGAQLDPNNHCPICDY